MEQYGGAKKPKKAKKVSTFSKTTKTRSKSKAKAKGGNFMAPTDLGPLVNSARLLALDRADAALRRKTKKEKMKGGHCEPIPLSEKTMFIKNPKENNIKNLRNTEILKNYNFNNPKYELSNQNPEISINCLKENEYYISIKIFCNGQFQTYNFNEITYKSLQDAKDWLSLRKNQLFLIGFALNNFHEQCKNPEYLSAFEKSKLPKQPNNRPILSTPNVQRKGIVRTSKMHPVPDLSRFPKPSN